jgi:1-acyl-sn-glycerol-3-phosphate acyltransferase
MIKQEESYIAIARHRSYWDIPLLAVGLGWRNRIHFIARKGLLRNPLFHPLVKLYATAIDRERFSRADFRRILQALKRERIIGIFPEGTTRQRVDVKSGAIHFARLTGKKLLPVNIQPRGAYPPRYPFSFPQVTIAIGRPFTLAELDVDREENERCTTQYQQLGRQLMERVDTA